jgi:GNAT superfamily N-acetyltransferase
MWSRSDVKVQKVYLVFAFGVLSRLVLPLKSKRGGMQAVEPKEGLSFLPIRPQSVREISRTLCSMDPWLTMNYKPEVIEFYLLREDPALSRYSIMVSENLAGVLSLRFPWLFGPFIELVALFDGFRDRGIGSRIVEWVSLNHEAANVWVTVSAFNSGAQRFYGKMGFEKTAMLEDLIKPGWSEILLRKKLAVPNKSRNEQPV